MGSWWPSGTVFPLCQSRSSWNRCPQTGAGLQATRVAAYAPSDITHSRSQHCESLWRTYYCGNCLNAHFADRLRAARRYRSTSSMQVCRSARGSVCQGSVRISTWLSFSTARQRQTPPPSATSGRQYHYPSELIAEDIPSAELSSSNMRAKAASVVHHRWLLPAACELPHIGGVRKSRSRPTLRQVSVSYPLRIRPAFGVMTWVIFYDPVVLGGAHAGGHLGAAMPDAFRIRIAPVYFCLGHLRHRLPSCPKCRIPPARCCEFPQRTWLNDVKQGACYLEANVLQ